MGIEGIVDCLAHKLIVEGLEGHVHPQEIHAKSDHLFDPIARVLADALDVFDRQIADNVRLTREQSGNPGRFLLHPFDNHFLDLRLGSPVIVIAPQHQIAAALPTDKFIGAGAVGVIVQLIAGVLAENDSGSPGGTA